MICWRYSVMPAPFGGTAEPSETRFEHGGAQGRIERLHFGGPARADIRREDSAAAASVPRKRNGLRLSLGVGWADADPGRVEPGAVPLAAWGYHQPGVAEQGTD